MAKTLAGVLAVSIAALLFAGCTDARTSPDSPVTDSKSTQRSTASTISSSDYEADIKALCKTVESLQRAAKSLQSQLDSADKRNSGAYIDSAPRLKSGGYC